LKAGCRTSLRDGKLPGGCSPEYFGRNEEKLGRISFLTGGETTVNRFQIRKLMCRGGKIKGRTDKVRNQLLILVTTLRKRDFGIGKVVNFTVKERGKL